MREIGKFFARVAPWNWLSRHFMRAGVLCGLFVCLEALAGEFPERPVQMIVPWASASDAVLRAFADKASQYLGQPIVIVNKPGASGTLGPSFMAHTSKPDGYTIAQIPISLFRLPHLQSVDYDPISDFTYIIGLSGYTSGVVVGADAPWQSWGEFITYAKNNPGKVSFGTAGVNTTLDITMKQIAKKEGIQWDAVPFKGSGEGIASLLGGHITALAGTSASWNAMVDSGKFRLLVTWGDKRTSRWPKVPTLKELGYGIVANSPYGLAGPKGIPPQVVEVLHNAFKKALDDPEMKRILDQMGEDPAYLGTEDYNKYVRAEYEEQRRIVKDLNLAQP